MLYKKKKEGGGGGGGGRGEEGREGVKEKEGGRARETREKDFREWLALL